METCSTGWPTATARAASTHASSIPRQNTRSVPSLRWDVPRRSQFDDLVHKFRTQQTGCRPRPDRLCARRAHWEYLDDQAAETLNYLEACASLNTGYHCTNTLSAAPCSLWHFQ